MEDQPYFGTAKMFVLSFVVSFLVLGFMMVFLLLRLTAPTPQQSPAPSLGSTVYLPGSQDRLTLFAVLEGQTPNSDTFVLAGFFPDIGYMPVMVLPRQLALQNTTLQQLYRQQGAVASVQALEETFGIAVDRVAALPDAAFSTLIDRMGSVDFRLPVRLENTAVGPLAAGLHQFDGAKTLALLNCAQWPQGEVQRCGTAATLFTEMINSHLPAVLGSNAESLFKTAVNSCSHTNLNLLDYEAYLPAARFMARLEVSPGQALELSGSFGGSGAFLPDSSGVELLHNTFQTAA